MIPENSPPQPAFGSLSCFNHHSSLGIAWNNWELLIRLLNPAEHAHFCSNRSRSNLGFYQNLTWSGLGNVNRLQGTLRWTGKDDGSGFDHR